MMSSPAPQAVDPPAAPRAGGDLRAARERLGWSIETVAAGLRIRQPHLEALEDGRIDLLPGNAYAVGFLRSYAAALGLDPDEIGRRFKAEAAAVNRRTELAFPAPMPERGMPAGALVLLGVVLAIGAYAGWYRLSGEGKLPAETVIAVPERLAPLAQQAAPPVAPPALVAKSEPAVAPAAVASAAPLSTSAASPSDASPSAAPPAAVVVSIAPPPAGLDATPPVPSVSPTSAAAAPMPPMSMAQPTAAAAGPPDSGQRIVIQATADAWVEVRDASGNVLLNRILHAGDSWAVPAQPGLVLTTGNAGGTVLQVDGVATSALGNPGAVRRDLPLDPNLIRQGKLTPAAANPVQPVSLRANGQ